MTLTGLLSLFVSCFDGAGLGSDKLLCLAHSCQPKTVEVGEVVTRAARSLALYKGMSSEILKAATRGGQRLSAAFVACPGVLGTRRSSKRTLRAVDGILFSSIQSSILISLTKRKEYPVHRLLQPGGHKGIVSSWL